MSATGLLSANSLMNLLADIPTFQGVTGGTLGTRLGLGAVHDLASVIVIVDFTQMEGVTWAQLADYIAVAALTNVDPNKNYADVPSILALFDTSAESRPRGLSDWDRA